MTPCRHCHTKHACCARRLCWTCYHTPTVRDLYPSANKRSPWDGESIHAPPASVPTDASPGTAQKLDALAARAEAGETLWHPRDRPPEADTVGMPLEASHGSRGGRQGRPEATDDYEERLMRRGRIAT